MTIRYVTRWALSTGIRKVEGEYTEDGDYFTGGTGFARVFVSKREAFETFTEALGVARTMAKKKAVSLRQSADAMADPNWEPKGLKE